MRFDSASNVPCSLVISSLGIFLSFPSSVFWKARVSPLWFLGRVLWLLYWKVERRERSMAPPAVDKATIYSAFKFQQLKAEVRKRGIMTRGTKRSQAIGQL